MFGGVWNFMKRHRRKFFITGAVVGGAMLFGKYVFRKLQDIQEREAAECLTFARRQHHFDSNQRTCNMTVLSMLPTLREALMQALESEALTSQLKSKPANKLQIWEQLKIMSFTRTISAVYCCCMLIVLLRVQLNIVGGYMYLDSLILNKNGMSKDQAFATPEIQHNYLQMVHYLVGQGLTELVTAVQAAVETSLSNVSLKQQMSLQGIQDLINSVREQVEFRQHNGYHDASTSSLCCYLIPADNQVNEARSLTHEELAMNKLMTETRDTLESADFHTVLTMCLDTAFVRLVDKIAEYFKPCPPESADSLTTSDSFSPNDISMPLAKVIPVMNGLINTVCGDAPNQFVQELLLKEQVKDFAANVYEAFSQPALDDGQGPA